MKKIATLLAFVSGLILATSASADDPKSSDRKEKPTCYVYCDTCSRCVEFGTGLEGCLRYESYSCNCREVCN